MIRPAVANGVIELHPRRLLEMKTVALLNAPLDDRHLLHQIKIQSGVCSCRMPKSWMLHVLHPYMYLL